MAVEDCAEEVSPSLPAYFAGFVDMVLQFGARGKVQHDEVLWGEFDVFVRVDPFMRLASRVHKRVDYALASKNLI
jgi:hypothetical protein